MTLSKNILTKNSLSKTVLSNVSLKTGGATPYVMLFSAQGPNDKPFSSSGRGKFVCLKCPGNLSSF